MGGNVVDCLIQFCRHPVYLLRLHRFIAHWHALLLMALYLLAGCSRSQQPPILIYPDGIDLFTCPYNAECED